MHRKRGKKKKKKIPTAAYDEWHSMKCLLSDADIPTPPNSIALCSIMYMYKVN